MDSQKWRWRDVGYQNRCAMIGSPPKKGGRWENEIFTKNPPCKVINVTGVVAPHARLCLFCDLAGSQTIYGMIPI